MNELLKIKAPKMKYYLLFGSLLVFSCIFLYILYELTPLNKSWILLIAIIYGVLVVLALLSLFPSDLIISREVVRFRGEKIPIRKILYYRWLQSDDWKFLPLYIDDVIGLQLFIISSSNEVRPVIYAGSRILLHVNEIDKLFNGFGIRKINHIEEIKEIINKPFYKILPE
jgi:hypothetical protein